MGISESTPIPGPQLASADGEKRRVLANAAANWVGFAAALVVSFYMSPILVHGLGDRRFGIWSLVDSVIAYLALADLGVGAAVLRFVARFEGLRDRDSLNRVFSTSLAIFVVAGCLAGVVSLGLAFGWSQPLGVDPDLATDTRWLLVLLGLNLGIGLPMGIFQTVLAGLSRYVAKNAISVFIMLVRSGLLLLVLRNGGGIPAVTVVITFCGISGHLCAAFLARRYLPGLRFSLAFVDRKTLRTIWGFSLWMFVAMIAGRVSFHSDAIVIAAMLDVESITYFAIAARLLGLCREPILTVTAVLTPAVSRLDAVGNASAVRSILTTASRYLLFLAVAVVAGLVLLGHPFLSLWMGPRYAERCYPVMIILAAPMPLTVVGNVAAKVLYGTGRVRAFAYLAVVQAIANLSLSVALAVPYGIAGVALGTAIPSVFYAVGVVACACRVVRIGLVDCLVRSMLRPLLASAVLIAAFAVAVEAMPPTSWPSLILDGCIGLVPYGAAVLVLEPRILRAFLGFLGRSVSSLRNGAPAPDVAAAVSASTELPLADVQSHR